MPAGRRNMHEWTVGNSTNKISFAKIKKESGGKFMHGSGIRIGYRNSSSEMIACNVGSFEY